MKQKECPRSVVDRFQQSVVLVKEISVANTVKKQTGSFPGGMDQSKWPIRWFDAVYMDTIEHNRVQAAYDEAIDNSR